MPVPEKQSKTFESLRRGDEDGGFFQKTKISDSNKPNVQTFQFS